MFPGLDVNLPQHLALAGLAINPDLRASPAVFLRHALTLAGSLGCSGIHLDATASGLRPRELDRSARRDVASAIRRQGLTCSGVDLLIPPAHFSQQATVSRAVDATLDAIAMVRELAGLIENAGRVCCLSLPSDIAPPTLQTLTDQAQREDVHLAIEWTPQPPDASQPSALASSQSLGVMLDCARLLLAGQTPHEAIAKHGRSIACIRASDADRAQRVPLGAGRLDRTFTIAAIQTCTKLAAEGRDQQSFALVLDAAGLSVEAIRKL